LNEAPGTGRSVTSWGASSLGRLRDSTSVVRVAKPAAHTRCRVGWQLFVDRAQLDLEVSIRLGGRDRRAHGAERGQPRPSNTLDVAARECGTLRFSTDRAGASVSTSSTSNAIVAAVSQCHSVPARR